MFKKHIIKYFLCFLLMVFFTLFCVYENTALQFATMILFLVVFCVLVTCIISVFRNWAADKLYSFFPLLVCVISIMAPLMVGGEIRQAIFEYRLPQYHSIIDRFKEDSIEEERKLVNIELEEGEGHLAYAVFAVKDKGSTYIEFVTGGGFPVKHSGYLYSYSGNIEENSFITKRWPNFGKIEGNWYRISD